MTATNNINSIGDSNGIDEFSHPPKPTPYVFPDPVMILPESVPTLTTSRGPTNTRSSNNLNTKMANTDEFDINNGNNINSNKIIIPNENEPPIIKSIKSTKYNYISTINPKVISTISGTITNLAKYLYEI